MRQRVKNKEEKNEKIGRTEEQKNRNRENRILVKRELLFFNHDLLVQLQSIYRIGITTVESRM